MFRTKAKEAEERVARSLNFFNRKRENERIERENLRFARRLLEKPPSLDVRELEKTFDHHLEYRQLLLKVEAKKEYSKVLPGLKKTNTRTSENVTLSKSKDLSEKKEDKKQELPKEEAKNCDTKLEAAKTQEIKKEEAKKIDPNTVEAEKLNSPATQLPQAQKPLEKK